MRLLLPSLLLFSTAQANVTTGAGGVDIHYERHGSGDTAVVLVHGWTCDRTYWKEQVDEFAETYTVIAIDLAGHGESGNTRDDWSMKAFGADVAAVVKREDLENVVLVGHSMGGAVVVEAARLLGERVIKVIAVDTMQLPTQPPYSDEDSRALWAPFTDDFATALEQFVRQQFFLPSAPADVVDFVAKDMASADPAIALEAGHQLTTWDVPGGIAAISDVPFELINADYRPTDEAGLATVHSEAKVIIMEGTGHFPMLVQPEAFNTVLLSRMPN